MELGELRRIGLEGGLDGFGVCTVEPFDLARSDIEERRGAGYSAGMAFTFKDPATSTDIPVSLPWAERLVVGAASYLPEAGVPMGNEPGIGRIARFATVDHYRGLRAGLGAIAEELGRQGFRTELLVDDERLIDRAAAVRAGVGWWGKNTMVLAPGFGPWLLLGSVATDAPLPLTEPMERDCGACEACLPACPTGALVAPGILDARRCLAYWAQAPGKIPVEYRTLMGDRLYGCDDCLDACPPGRRLANTGSPSDGVDLIALLAASDAALLERFAHFYIPHRRARYLRRNALVALGNCGGRGAVEVVAGFLGHPDPLLRAHAAWALGRLGGPLAVAALRMALADERDEAVHPEIIGALG